MSVNKVHLAVPRSRDYREEFIERCVERRGLGSGMGLIEVPRVYVLSFLYDRWADVWRDVSMDAVTLVTAEQIDAGVYRLRYGNLYTYLLFCGIAIPYYNYIYDYEYTSKDGSVYRFNPRTGEGTYEEPSIG